MTKPKDPRYPTGWRGLGQPVDDRSDRVGFESGMTDAACLAHLRKVLSMVTPRQQSGLAAMTIMTGARCTALTRYHAYQARRHAFAKCPLLPPWWRLRLAIRRSRAHGMPTPIDGIPLPAPPPPRGCRVYRDGKVVVLDKPWVPPADGDEPWAGVLKEPLESMVQKALEPMMPMLEQALAVRRRRLADGDCRPR